MSLMIKLFAFSLVLGKLSQHFKNFTLDVIILIQKKEMYFFAFKILHLYTLYTFLNIIKNF